MPRRNVDLIFIAMAEAFRLDEIHKHVAAPQRLIVAGERLGRCILLAAHREGQKSIIDIYDDGHFRTGFVVLDNLPLRLNEYVILRSFKYAFTWGPVTLDQAKARRLRSRGLREIAPIDNAFPAHRHQHPVPQADVSRPHLRATANAVASMAALKFCDPKWLACRSRASQLNLCSTEIDGRTFP